MFFITFCYITVTVTITALHKHVTLVIVVFNSLLGSVQLRDPQMTAVDVKMMTLMNYVTVVNGLLCGVQPRDRRIRNL